MGERHRRTDPACSEYSGPPTGIAAGWRDRRSRGRGCRRCTMVRFARAGMPVPLIRPRIRLFGIW